MKITITYELENKDGKVLRKSVQEDYLMYALADKEFLMGHYGEVGVVVIDELKKEMDKNESNIRQTS